MSPHSWSFILYKRVYLHAEVQIGTSFEKKKLTNVNPNRLYSRAQKFKTTYIKVEFL